MLFAAAAAAAAAIQQVCLYVTAYILQCTLGSCLCAEIAPLHSVHSVHSVIQLLLQFYR
jgi:hypothetical protein